MVQLAHKARREGLLMVLCRTHELTLERLDQMLAQGAYADELGQIRVGELLDYARQPSLHPALPGLRPGESTEDALMRVFRGRPNAWLSSGYFKRTMGLPRWVLQGALGDLVSRGWLERRGVTSQTRYRCAQSPDEEQR